jgi:quercetin dioxygenase-like cupin family protein
VVKIVRMMEVGQDLVSGALFPGAPVARRSLISRQDSEQLNFTLLTFGPGSENAFHTHSHDQALVVVEGVGIVATEHEEHVVTAADVVLIPAGENHLHAARRGGTCSMLSITPQGATTTVTGS